ncbi:hypothetical protein DVH24_007757 [Malus domestica]|uniref:Uncharacterized protein n=1 Tax=Malus domestica TaxID=3750 RepID=A0A498JW37_MALDO|nr:hypothetical protein DVH24_007757 [Malus domestica]
MGFLFKYFGCDFGDFVYGFRFWVMVVNLVLLFVSRDPVFLVSDVSLQLTNAFVFKEIQFFGFLAFLCSLRRPLYLRRQTTKKPPQEFLHVFRRAAPPILRQFPAKPQRVGRFASFRRPSRPSRHFLAKPRSLFFVQIFVDFNFKNREVSGDSLTGMRIQLHTFRSCHETANYSLCGKIN